MDILKIFLIGEDEQCEITKAVLINHGYPLYTSIWNDQPPLHTWLLAVLFKGFGEHIAVARALALVFSLLLHLSLFATIVRITGCAIAFSAVAYLFASPAVAVLSCSAMLEVPAFSLALAGVAIYVNKRDAGRDGWFAVVGIFLGLALQCKLTSGIVCGAVAADMFFDRFRGRLVIGRPLFFLISASLLTFLAIGSATPGWSFDQLLASHGRASQSLEAPEFSLAVFTNQTDAVLIICILLPFLLFGKSCDDIMLPMFWLLFAICIHSVHRPYWQFYYLHFAIPLSWILGVAILRLIGSLNSLRSAGRRAIGLALFGSFICLLTFQSSNRLKEVHTYLLSRDGLADKRILYILNAEASGGFIFTRYPIYAFYSHLLLPPELAVLPMKRFWSGDLTEPQILGFVEKRPPDWLLLSPVDSSQPGWRKLIETKYVLRASGDQLDLFRLTGR